MIKVTYFSKTSGLEKPEKTTINIFDGRMFIQYSIPNKSKSVYTQMKKDGKVGILLSRGSLIQMFRDKTEDEILEIVQQDIKNGCYVAKEKTKKDVEVYDINIERK